MSFSIGTPVLFRNSHKGIVRFIGDVHYAKGQWFGIELDTPDGKNNGTLKGVSYFECTDKHGVMCKDYDIKAVNSKNGSNTANKTKTRNSNTSSSSTTSNSKKTSSATSTGIARPSVNEMRFMMQQMNLNMNGNNDDIREPSDVEIEMMIDMMMSDHQDHGPSIDHAHMPQPPVSDSKKIKSRIKLVVKDFPLHKAARSGDIKLVMKLLESEDPKFDIDSVDEHHMTALSWACKKESVSIATYLIERGSSINAIAGCSDYCNPLLAAAYKGNIEIVTLLVNAGGDLTCVDDILGQSVLHRAVDGFHVNMVSLLLSQWACDVNRRDMRGFTPICLATSKGRLDVTQMLVQNGADVNIHATGAKGATPLSLAVKQDHIVCVEYLLSGEVNAISDARSLVNAVTYSPQSLKLLKDLGGVKDSNIVDIDGITPIHIAAESGDVTALQQLIDWNGDVDFKQTGGDKKSALMVASENGHIECVKLLLEKNCDIAATDINGDTALHLAGINCHEEVYQILKFKSKSNVQMKTGSDVTLIRNKKGNLPQLRENKLDKCNIM